jgi:hypothetical protein
MEETLYNEKIKATVISNIKNKMKRLNLTTSIFFNVERADFIQLKSGLSVN